MKSRLNFDEFELDPANERLTRRGIVVSLQPQPMKVLLLLVARRGELVTRKELQDAVWGAGTFVDFDQGLNWCIRRIREVLGDDASAPRFIETVPRRGYRFIAVMRRTHNNMRWLTITAMALLVLTISGARTNAVTLVVLPFDNYGNDAIAADVTTEEVINRIGAIDPNHIKVIDRATAAKFKRKGECIIHIGEELGAQFVMEGSVQRTHTTAALYRVRDNTQVWATASSGDAAKSIAERVATTFHTVQRR